jgi:hypothetical protein
MERRRLIARLVLHNSENDAGSSFDISELV